MPATPNITLTATLEDIQGLAAGTTANPAKLRIALCGYYRTLPVIVGTTNIAKVGPYEILSTGGPISIPLWGNNQISPTNTYYEIAILDGEDNVLQCAAYIFNGPQTIDLSNVTQINPPPPVPETLIPVYTNPTTSATQNIASSVEIDSNLEVVGVTTSGIVNASSSGGALALDLSTSNIFRIVLHENITALTFSNPQPGAEYTFIVVQDGTGGWTLAWPAAALNPISPVNSAANGKTMWAGICDTDNTIIAPGYYP